MKRGGGGYAAYGWDNVCWGAYMLLAEILGAEDATYATAVCPRFY